MSFSGRTDGLDEATQHDFLDAEGPGTPTRMETSNCWMFAAMRNSGLLAAGQHILKDRKDEHFKRPCL
jgi:hypothetical protein